MAISPHDSITRSFPSPGFTRRASSFGGLLEQILHTWDVHNSINLYLIGKIPAGGFAAVPLNSKGRTVEEQLVHMNRVSPRLASFSHHREASEESC